MNRPSNRARRAFIVMAAVGSWSIAASALDWPQWRGPARSGVSRETGLLPAWPDEGPTLVWQQKDIGDGYGAPAVVGDRIYLLGNRGLDNEFVLALATSDGRPVWTTRLGMVGNPHQSPSYPKARSTPTVDGDLLFALSSEGDLACLETATGKIRWQKNVRHDFGGVPGEWAYAESPLVDDEVLVVTPGGSAATMVALDKRTGAVIWKAAVPGGDPAGYASAVVVDAGRKQYVQFLSKGVVGVDAASGRFLWRYEEAVKGPAQIPTPVVRGDLVYASVRGVGGALLRVKPDAEVDEVYLTRGLPNSNGGAVLVDEYLYGTTADGLVAADFRTGRVMWSAPSLGPGSLAAADGRLYLHGENGGVALVEVTPAAYRERGRFMPPDRPTHANAREMAWAHPVVANGRLYIRDLSSLWAYDVKRAR